MFCALEAAGKASEASANKNRVAKPKRRMWMPRERDCYDPAYSLRNGARLRRFTPCAGRGLEDARRHRQCAAYPDVARLFVPYDAEIRGSDVAQFVSGSVNVKW
jgi:hypothetical protein